MGLFSKIRKKINKRGMVPTINRNMMGTNRMMPIPKKFPSEEMMVSGVGTLPLKNLMLPDFLQRVPNPMQNLPNLNIPSGIQNLKFSPNFGNYVPMFNKGTTVDQEAISATPSMLVFNLNLQAENLMNQMLMEQANGEIERAMETGRQIQNINDQIAQIKGEFGDKSYMVDKALTDFTNMRNVNNNLRAVPFKFRAGNKPDASYYRRGAPERVEIDKREKQKEALDNFLSPVPGFSGGGIVNLLSKIPFLKRFFRPKSQSVLVDPISGRLTDVGETVLNRTRGDMTAPISSRGVNVGSKVLDDIPYQGMIGTKAGLASGKFRIPNPGRYAVPIPGAMSSMARNMMIDDVTRKALGLGAIGAGGYGVVTYPEELGALVAKGQLSFEEAFEKAKQAIQPSLLETKDAITDIGEDASTEIGIIRSRLQQGYQDEINRQRAEEIQQLMEEDKPLVPVFNEGGAANKDDIDETIAYASRIKKPTTVLTDFSDPLVDVEQEELLAELVKKAEIQTLIEELLQDKGRTVSDLDMMTILQQSSSGQPSMV